MPNARDVEATKAHHLHFMLCSSRTQRSCRSWVRRHRALPTQKEKVDLFAIEGEEMRRESREPDRTLAPIECMKRGGKSFTSKGEK